MARARSSDEEVPQLARVTKECMPSLILRSFLLCFAPQRVRFPFTACFYIMSASRYLFLFVKRK